MPQEQHLQTTTRGAALDAAFQRRLRFIVQYPLRDGIASALGAGKVEL